MPYAIYQGCFTGHGPVRGSGRKVLRVKNSRVGSGRVGSGRVGSGRVGSGGVRSLTGRVGSSLAGRIGSGGPVKHRGSGRVNLIRSDLYTEE